MKVQYNNIEIFKNNIVALKETSWDKDGDCPGYMTDSSIQVINFDKVKEAYIKNMGLSSTPCSNDALYIGDNEKIYFIEFKNGVVKNKKVFNVYNKIYDSLLIFNDIVQENISFCRENVSFILVYNEGKNPNGENTTNDGESSKIKIGKYFYAKAKKKYVRFGLERFEKIYFRDVYTYTEKEFEDDFLANIE
ncbi:MAG: hypothetical protein HDR04_07610 [Lachnospiraceae bacterium]|nr:hypothetical protein [Lachnospiraceae bacterium]